MTQESVLDANNNERRVIVPIPTENIKEFFTNKDIIFLVDYAGSRLKGQTFLTYLSNLNVPSDVVLTPETFTKEIYFEVMKAYMTQRMLTSSKTLDHYVAQMLLLAKGVEFKDIPYLTMVDEETIFEFIVHNLGMVLNWLFFIDSSPVFAASAIPVLNEKFKPAENFEVIEDKEVVGHNVVNLYSVPGFMQMYFSLPGATYREAYFKHQFEDYMFANKRLVEYFNNKWNVISLAFEAMASGELDAEDPSKFFAKLKEKVDAGEPATPENG